MPDAYADKYAKQIADLVQQAYNDGFTAGEQAMQQRILAAATGQTLGGSVVTDSLLSRKTSTTTLTKRAPRGLVGEVIEAVLVNEPGLTIAEIEDKATTLDSRVAPKSIANELHRKKDIKYRQDGRKWSLLGKENPEGNADGDNSGLNDMF